MGKELPEHDALPLTSLRPCDRCAGKMVPMFYVLDIRLGTVDADETDQVLGMHRMLGRGSMPIVEALAPSKPVKIMRKCLGNYHLCNDCNVGFLAYMESGK